VEVVTANFSTHLLISVSIYPAALPTILAEVIIYPAIFTALFGLNQGHIIRIIIRIMLLSFCQDCRQHRREQLSFQIFHNNQYLDLTIFESTLGTIEY
jgi:hypothetical protein